MKFFKMLWCIEKAQEKGQCKP